MSSHMIGSILSSGGGGMNHGDTTLQSERSTLGGGANSAGGGFRLGLSSKQALERLFHEVHTELQQYSSESGLRRTEDCQSMWASLPYHYHHANSTIRWHNALLILLGALSLIVCYLVESSRHIPGCLTLVVEAVGVVTLLLLSSLINWWDVKLRNNDMFTRAQFLLDQIQETLIHMQQQQSSPIWPESLYPSRHAPVSPSVSLQWTYRDNKLVNLPCNLLVKGDVVEVRPGQVVHARVKQLSTSSKSDPLGLVLEAGQSYNPLEGQTEDPCSTSRLHSPMDKLTCVVQETPFVNSLRKCLVYSLDKPAGPWEAKRNAVCVDVIERRILPIAVLTGLFVNGVLFIAEGDMVGLQIEMYLLHQVYILIPLVPLVFPVVWLLWNCITTAVLLAYCQERCRKGTSKLTTLKHVWKHFISIISGMSPSLSRTSNLLHGVGNTTIFSCVDKRGVLSWPNPKVERVFFIRPSEQLGDSRESELDGGGGGETSDDGSIDAVYVPEIMDLSCDQDENFIVHFDDDRWHQYLPSLKPLGLNILLNTCNEVVEDSYSKFADHLLCVSSLENHSVAVVNRRCACELSEAIGFAQNATENYEVKNYIQSFRESQPFDPSDTFKVRRIKAILRKKTPYPFLCSVVVHDTSTGLQQLFTQGTADMLCDVCPDFWDGKGIHPLSSDLRKKIHDFYTRSSLSAYCTAFAYRPVFSEFSKVLENFYLELPSGKNRKEEDFDNVHSTDYVTDAKGLAKAQSGQIFLGMVVMQYKAMPDVMDLIEEFDNRLIRFVHFSHENELRSRVFAEKLGLETGWNCHVSLYSPPEVATGGSEHSSKAASLTTLRSFAHNVINANQKLKTLQSQPMVNGTNEQLDSQSTPESSAAAGMKGGGGGSPGNQLDLSQTCSANMLENGGKLASNRSRHPYSTQYSAASCSCNVSKSVGCGGDYPMSLGNSSANSSFRGQTPGGGTETRMMSSSLSYSTAPVATSTLVQPAAVSGYTHTHTPAVVQGNNSSVTSGICSDMSDDPHDPSSNHMYSKFREIGIQTGGINDKPLIQPQQLAVNTASMEDREEGVRLDDMFSRLEKLEQMKRRSLDEDQINVGVWEPRPCDAIEEERDSQRDELISLPALPGLNGSGGHGDSQESLSSPDSPHIMHSADRHYGQNARASTLSDKSPMHGCGGGGLKSPSRHYPMGQPAVDSPCAIHSPPPMDYRVAGGDGSMRHRGVGSESGAFRQPPPRESYNFNPAAPGLPQYGAAAAPGGNLFDPSSRCGTGSSHHNQHHPDTPNSYNLADCHHSSSNTLLSSKGVANTTLDRSLSLRSRGSRRGDRTDPASESLLTNSYDLDKSRGMPQRSDTGTSVQTLHHQPHPEPDAISRTSEASTTAGGGSEMFDDLYDLSNRAKLPRGVENIRPHLEHVDNVPLLVPLFTDCTPEATKEMITIMQENKEVVCVYGSSLNVTNVDIFLQADVSIGVLPFVPQPCVRHNVSFDPYLTDGKHLSPLGLASALGALPCSLEVLRTVPVTSIFRRGALLTENLKTALFFLLSCHLSIITTQILCALIFQPPPFSGSLILWLVGFVLPLLSSALLANPRCQNSADWSTNSKNAGKVQPSDIRDFLTVFMMRFFPMCLMMPLLEICVLDTMCHYIPKPRVCNIPHGNINSTQPWNGFRGDYHGALAVAQNMVAWFFVLYLCFISASYVFPKTYIWVKLPISNICWTLLCPLVITIQFFYLLSDVRCYKTTTPPYTLDNSPGYAWLGGVAWAIVMLITSELVKMYEIRKAFRKHRRCKLQFGTKLGMNSPF